LDTYNELVQVINRNFCLDIISIRVLVDHTYSKVYLLESAADKYVLKEMGEGNYDKIEGESDLTGFLVRKGIRVPKIYHAASGGHVVFYNGYIYVLYEFIDGTSFALNTAPGWFLEKSAQTLGQIQHALKEYKRLPLQFGSNFFVSEKYDRVSKSIDEKMALAAEKRDAALAAALAERLSHIKRVSRFEFDCGKFTYVNTHGDFYINQVIVRDGELYTIDWSNPHYLPACFEVMMSYAYAAPESIDGSIDIERFSRYYYEYLRRARITLSDYDLKIMPYFIYYYCIFCSFTPPYGDLPDDYYEIANFTDRLANWLFHNVDDLSAELTRLT